MRQSPVIAAVALLTACAPAVGPGPTTVSAVPPEGISVRGITGTSGWVQSSGHLLDTMSQEMDFLVNRCASPRPGMRPASVKFHVDRMLYDGKTGTIGAFREQTLVGRVEVTAHRPRELLLRAPISVTIFVDPLRESDDTRERALARAFAESACALMTVPQASAANRAG